MLRKSHEDSKKTQTIVLSSAIESVTSDNGKILLQFLGHLFSLPIPYSLVNDYFDRYFSEESNATRFDFLDEGLKSLEEISLVDIQKEENIIQSLKVHELVQDIIKQKLPQVNRTARDRLAPS